MSRKNQRIRLNFHQHFRRNQFAHFDHAGRRANVLEEFSVGAANLFFLPFAGKLRIRIHEDHQRREMILEGVVSILEGMNPRMLEVKLGGFLDAPNSAGKERAA